MNIYSDKKTILTIVAVLIFLYFIYSERATKAEKWTLLKGAPQKWKYDFIRDPSICDTGYNDQECKFSAVNCLNNPNSYFYEEAQKQ